MQDLNTLAKQIHENAKAKGFWDAPRNTGEVFMLIVSELGEALEADRKGRRASLEAYEFYKVDKMQDTAAFEQHIKDTFEDELADVVIRILDWCAYAGIRVYAIQEESVSENIGESLLSVTKLMASAHGWVNIGGFNDNVQHCLSGAISVLSNLADAQGFDLIRHIELKMKYNETRERLHGKKY